MELVQKSKKFLDGLFAAIEDSFEKFAQIIF